jgi:hypothetical protein
MTQHLEWFEQRRPQQSVLPTGGLPPHRYPLFQPPNSGQFEPLVNCLPDIAMTHTRAIYFQRCLNHMMGQKKTAKTGKNKLLQFLRHVFFQLLRLSFQELAYLLQGTQSRQTRFGLLE